MAVDIHILCVCKLRALYDTLTDTGYPLETLIFYPITQIHRTGNGSVPGLPRNHISACKRLSLRDVCRLARRTGCSRWVGLFALPLRTTHNSDQQPPGGRKWTSLTANLSRLRRYKPVGRLRYPRSPHFEYSSGRSPKVATGSVVLYQVFGLTVSARLSGPFYILPLEPSAYRSQAVVPVLSAVAPCHGQRPGA